MTEKYRTQCRIIFSPFLLQVQPSTKVCLSEDKICGGSHDCLMYTEFPKFTENSLSCTVEPIFNTSNSENHCYNDRAKKNTFFSYIQFIFAKLTPLPNM